MDQALSSRATRMLACAGALLFASGCLTGVNVGQDGQGGHPTGTSSSSTGTGSGEVATGATCTSPSALLCNWGKPGGPCGGSRPNKKDCDTGTVCLGDTADTEGTCVFPGDVLSSPGDDCVNTTGTACPWDHACNSTFFPGGVGGTCAVTPTNCSLEDPGTGLVSSATITLDGDGPTQHFGYACTVSWASQLTGEANAFLVLPGKDTLALLGCADPQGEETLGRIDLRVPLTTAGTTGSFSGGVDYSPPWVGGDPVSNFMPTVGTTPIFTLTEITAEVVRGTFDVHVTSAGAPTNPPPDAQRHLTGTFDVCRVPDHAGF